MAFDGVTIRHVCAELRAAAGAHVEKIYMPAREDVILALKWKGGSGKLLLTANAGSPRLHFTESQAENPQSPPMFCMLLRKHLGNARLVAVRQDGLERIVNLDFDAVNEIGDEVRLTLAVEVMGRHSNLILVNGEGKILDAVKRVDAEMSSVRQVLPGMAYTLPPAAQTACVLDCEPEDALDAVLRAEGDPSPQKAILTLQGFSPLLAREGAYVAGLENTPRVSEMNEAAKARLLDWLRSITPLVRDCAGTPTLLLDEDGKPADFTFLPIRQYGALRTEKVYPRFSALLDAFYAERTRLDRMKQRSHDLLILLQNARDRAARKVAVQKQELETSRQREELRLRAELLTANAHGIPRGSTTARVVNYYDPDMAEVEIPLDARLSAIENAQKLYAEYRKAATAEQMLVGLIAKGEEQVLYLESVLDEVTRSQGESELSEIRRELAETGYVKRRSLGRSKPVKLPPLRYRSDDGFLILVGRNNMQNDRLTLREANRNDVWFHVQKMHGAHVIVCAEGQDVPDRTLTQAAELAAWHSEARSALNVPVDYTRIRYVKKPQGAAPGRVIYTDYRTAYVKGEASAQAE